MKVGKKTEFCHIAPTSMLPVFCKDRSHHLILAHLVEADEEYRNFYTCQTGVKILDNSAFEMYKQGRPMYDSNKLVEMAQAVGADYAVSSDYPGEPRNKTQEAAKQLRNKFRTHGIGLFYCPQSRVGNKQELLEAFWWTLDEKGGSDLVDYIGFSILAIPNAYGVEKDNKLQRFMARWKFMQELEQTGFFVEAERQGKKLHLLGMVDGPNEILLLKPWLKYFDSWDSSAAIWAGLNGVKFDTTPTGLRHGKFEKEVDFDYVGEDNGALIDGIALALENQKYIDRILGEQ